MTEKEKMLEGKIYDPSDCELAYLREKAHKLTFEFNKLSEFDPKRKEILNELIPNNNDVCLVGPIYFDYGCFTSFGKGCYANFNLTILDCAKVEIGDNVFMGPNVSIVTPVHPLRYQERNMYKKENGVITDDEYAKPIKIGSNCWIASNVVIIGGVTIGEGSVIGAGSVVTHDIEPNSLAFGNPCTVKRKITEKDKLDASLFE